MLHINWIQRWKYPLEWMSLIQALILLIFLPNERIRGFRVIWRERERQWASIRISLTLLSPDILTNTHTHTRFTFTRFYIALYILYTLFPYINFCNVLLYEPCNRSQLYILFNWLRPIDSLSCPLSQRNHSFGPVWSVMFAFYPPTAKLLCVGRNEEEHTLSKCW